MPVTFTFTEEDFSQVMTEVSELEASVAKLRSNIDPCERDLCVVADIMFYELDRLRSNLKACVISSRS